MSIEKAFTFAEEEEVGLAKRTEDEEFIDSNKTREKTHRALLEPFKRLLSQLRERIDNHEYSVIIGDDVTGRIPTLIIDRMMKDVYAKDGKKAPKTIFFAGKCGNFGLDEQKRIEQRTVKEYISHALSSPDLFSGNKRDSKLRDKRGRILIVTETIATGGALEPLTKALQELDMPYDIMTLALSEESRARLEEKLKAKIYSGSSKPVYCSWELEGIVKDRSIPESVISRTRRVEERSARENEKIREKVELGRYYVNTISRKLIEWYQGSQND